MFSFLHRFRRPAAALLIPWLSFFLADVLIYAFTDVTGWCSLAFSAVWSAVFSGILLLLPRLAEHIAFLLFYYCSVVYAIIQTGYFQIFGKFMWLNDLLYLRDGAEFAGSVFSFLSPGFVIAAILLLVWGTIASRLRPETSCSRRKFLIVSPCILVAVSLLPYLLDIACSDDSKSLGLGTDFYAGKSLRRAYDLMYDAKKVYSLCGLYQTVGRDIAVHLIEPQLPGNKAEETEQLAAIESFFDEYGSSGETNDMTGLFAGKNVILVLMESADDWAINETDAPTITKMMQEGINFTNMYTPLYGSVRTFNSEFAMNTGIFSPTDGNLTFSYCENDFSESLPNLFRKAGYSANAFHYNSPSFYSRGIMEPAMGYENYICYSDYTEYGNTFSQQLDEDAFVLTNESLRDMLLCEEPFCNFVISRNAHMPYSTQDSVSRYAIEKYPQYEGVDTCEEVGYYYAKINLLDDFFAELITQLDEKDLLNNTVIVGITDHYSYSMKDQERVLELSDVPVDLMVEKTPFFIWSADMEEPVTVDKTINTSDVLPTLLNLFGMDTDYRYIGHDAFDPDYDGYAIFSDGSWITGDIVYQDGTVIHEFYDGAAANADLDDMNELAQRYIETSNLILESDYYAK
ncbi:MAG: sulfatase-like hydrolase/transferase [Clostridia bacterium]|nr:sulfatase-like hydrolase/transferase [Clostridia bacterium]